ncbi:serine/threonine-protein kinase [Yinghuangia sp. YIM S09857]|uniref:serine/threonine-protein kinase n=1 Tax=Yinghuangia sp. YIM S09857 TaxID=3436929 RepID=UPI003F53DAF1
MRVLNGRYELLETVGQGGMGQVWRGRDRELARIVGVKTLPGELSRQPEFRERFQREARTVAALAHPGITVLHDFGRDDDPADPVPFLVMEFVEGRSLAALIRSGPVPVAQAVAIARDIADALAHSHRAGIVHRDIKPSNVMLTPTGTVKVLDFGIAHLLADTVPRLTATGRIVGTPAYMSPEQAMGEPVDGRADQYSVGCVLFELLCGRPPFTGDSAFSVLNQHLTRPASAPSRRRGDVPPELDAVVLRLLGKAAHERYPTMDAVSQALATYADGRLPRESPGPSTRTLPRPVPAPRGIEPASSARSAETVVNPHVGAPPRRVTAVVSGVAALIAALAALTPWCSQQGLGRTDHPSLADDRVHAGIDSHLGQGVLGASVLAAVLSLVFIRRGHAALMAGATALAVLGTVGAAVTVVDPAVFSWATLDGWNAGDFQATSNEVRKTNPAAQPGVYVAAVGCAVAAAAGLLAYRRAREGRAVRAIPAYGSPVRMEGD